MGGRSDDSAHEVFAAQVKALADAAKDAVERF
jgi:hypothetical protein